MKKTSGIVGMCLLACGCGSSTQPITSTTVVPDLDTFTVDGWALSVLAENEPVNDPALDAGRAVWGRQSYSGYSGHTAAVFLYDAQGRTLATISEGLDAFDVDLVGDLLVCSVPRDDRWDVLLFDLGKKEERIIGSSRWALRDSQFADGFVVWTQRASQSHQRISALMSFELASGKTRVIADLSHDLTGLGDVWVGESWVVFEAWGSGPDPVLRAARLGGEGGLTELPSDITPQDLEGDHLYYVTRTRTGEEELRHLDLRTGEDELVRSGGEYQSVRVDKDHLAWATWEDGHAAIVCIDRATGDEVHIPSPQGMVGHLVLRGNLLLWKRVPGPPQPTDDPTHLFVYDIARGKTTDLGSLYDYEQWYTTDGESILFPDRQVQNGPVRLILAEPRTGEESAQ